MTMRPLPGWLLRLYPHVQGSARRAPAAPAFAPGDAVTVRAPGEPGHTRRPAYLWGKRGIVVRHHGAMTFPDARARGEKGPPFHLYTVSFQGRELWGPDADPALSINVDLFEPYLERS
jgi:nitrile hydratase